MTLVGFCIEFGSRSIDRRTKIDFDICDIAAQLICDLIDIQSLLDKLKIFF